MTPKATVEEWVDRFNSADASAIAELYHDDAVNHQMPLGKVEGKSAILDMFQDEFAAAEMVCIPVQILEDGEWAVLEWRDPRDFPGCGFFRVIDGKIKTQRGYWDRLTFQSLYRTTLR